MVPQGRALTEAKTSCAFGRHPLFRHSQMFLHTSQVLLEDIPERSTTVQPYYCLVSCHPVWRKWFTFSQAYLFVITILHPSSNSPGSPTVLVSQASFTCVAVYASFWHILQDQVAGVIQSVALRTSTKGILDVSRQTLLKTFSQTLSPPKLIARCAGRNARRGLRATCGH